MFERPKTPLSDHHPGLAEGFGGRGAKRTRADQRKAGRGSQLILFCSCGQAIPAVAGLCRSCYRRLRYSALFFGGNRASVLERDGRACRACQSQHYLHVHHCHPGDHTRLVTLCAGCHARVHRTRILGHWLSEILVVLWREWHPDAVEQLQLPVEMSAGVLAAGGWQIFSDFPAGIVAQPSPEDEPDGSGKHSRIFQAGFDWSRETLEGELEGPRVG